MIQFRDITPAKNPACKLSPTEGDWVGTFDDLIKGREGEYRIRFKDNRNGGDTAYPCAELLSDGTLVCTTYGHFEPNYTAYILSERFKIQDLDKIAKKLKKEGQKLIKNNMGDNKDFVFDPNDPDAINAKIRGN